jgi:CheY-like chemotaxis protein
LARKILLADDSVTAQNMGRKILADAGYDVVTVNNGSAALKRISEVKPDLIVLDVYMPGYSGLEVCQRLKDNAETEHIPVLLTVGKLEPFKPEEARRVRADAHIIKPFEASELLTAIMKLEDRMVPQQADGSRFTTSVSGVERFGGEQDSKKSEGGDTDTGWKSRLRFPSKKKKDEPEPEPEDAEAAPFRDFRKGKGKTAASAPFKVKAPAPPGQEPGLVPDIPRDITPEELDALSALAAKLDGPIPEAEAVAPLADKMGPATVAAPEVPVSTPEAKSEETRAAKAETKEAVPEFPVEAPAVAESAAVEMPVEHAEAATEAVARAATEVQDQSLAPQSSEAPKTELVATVPVNIAQFAEEAAPVDRADEPTFASAADAVAQAAQETTPEKTPEEPVEAVAESQTAVGSAATEAIATENLESKSNASTAEIEEAKAPDLQAEEPKAKTKVEEPSPASVEQPVAASVPVAEEPSPSDEELAEALRLLTPSAGHADVTTIPTHGTLVAAGQLLAEEAARNASAGPRWMAQPVALSSEEAALSLEAEMLHAFATMPASGAAGVSVISAAVENRLASMDSVDRGNGDGSTHGAHAPKVEASAAEISADANKTTPFVVEGSHRAVEAVAEVNPVEAKNIEASAAAAEQNYAPAKAVEAESAEEAAPITFADAMGKNEADADQENVMAGTPANGAGSSAALEDQDEDSSPEVGSEESMGKEVKGKKSNWHQIRNAPANAAAGSDVVEAAKQAAEETPKVMAAAAAEGSSSSVPDAGTIASIVDSVMADLRPKIVEEIAKKLAGK